MARVGAFLVPPYGKDDQEHYCTSTSSSASVLLAKADVLVPYSTVTWRLLNTQLLITIRMDLPVVGGSNHPTSGTFALRSLQESSSQSITEDAQSPNATDNEVEGAAQNETEAELSAYSYFPSDSPSKVPSFSPTWSPSAAPTTFEMKFVNSNDSQIIRDTFRLYGSLYLVFFISFCCLRRKFPRLFNIRSWVPELQTDLAKNAEYGFFSWCWKVFLISDDDLLLTCGMDALCFLRSLRLGAKLSFLGTINALWLVPLYMNSEDSPETEMLSDPFVLMTMGNVPNNSPRFVGTVIAAYITILTSMYMISKEYDWFTKYRHRYLSQLKPRNYSVYVSGIPEEFRSSYALADYFRQSTSWSEAVYEAHVAMDIPSLEAKVTKRQNLVEKIEHIMALERETGSTLTHHHMNVKRVLKGEGVQKVQSVITYMKQLEKLNSQISLEAAHVRGSNHRMRQHLTRSFDTTRNLPAFDPLSLMEESSSFCDRRQSLLKPNGTEQTMEALQEANASNTRQSHGGSDIDDIEEGSSLARRDSRGNLDIHILHPSFSDDRLASVAVTEPSTDESRYDSQQPNENNSASDSPHPFLAMFGLDTSMFSQSTLDLNGIRDAKDTLNSLSVGSNDKIYDDSIDAASYKGSDCDNDSNNRSNGPSCNQMMEPINGEYDLSCHDRPDNIGQGTCDADIAGVMGISAELPEVILNDKSTDSIPFANPDRPFSFRDGVTSGMRSSAIKMVDRTAHVGSRVKRVSIASASTVLAARNIGVSGVKKAADFGLQKIQQAPDIGVHIASSAAAVVPLRFNRTQGQALEAGFVVFRDLYTTQAARQMLHHHIAHSMLVEPAPDPEEVFWRNVGLPQRARRSGYLLSMVATSTLCFFWSIPMAFFSSLTEVTTLKESLPILAEFLDEYESLESFLVVIAPLLTVTLNDAVLPGILKWFATWEGHVGASVLVSSLFVKLCAFVFIQTFFVSAVSGSITSELTNFLENPQQIVNLLANSLPAQSSYFIQICFVFTFLFQGLDLLRAYPLGMAFLRRYVFGPRLTAKERRKTWNMFNSLEDPPEFWHAEVSAQLMLFFVVFFVYSTIAPITSVFLFFCFLICESGYRYHFVHNHKPTPDSGGKLWQGFIQVLLASMIIGQCTLFGLLILKSTVWALPALAPLGVLTILFIIYTIPKRNHVASHLPTLKCVTADKKNKEDGITISQFAAQKYLQPALKAKPLWPEHMVINRPRVRTMSRDGTK